MRRFRSQEKKMYRPKLKIARKSLILFVANKVLIKFTSNSKLERIRQKRL